ALHRATEHDLPLQRLSSFLRHILFPPDLIAPTVVAMIGNDRLDKPVESSEVLFAVDTVDTGHQHRHEWLHFILAAGCVSEFRFQKHTFRAEEFLFFLLRAFALDLVDRIEKLANLSGLQTNAIGEEIPHFLCEIDELVCFERGKRLQPANFFHHISFGKRGTSAIAPGSTVTEPTSSCVGLPSAMSILLLRLRTLSRVLTS